TAGALIVPCLSLTPVAGGGEEVIDRGPDEVGKHALGDRTHFGHAVGAFVVLLLGRLRRPSVRKARDDPEQPVADAAQVARGGPARAVPAAAQAPRDAGGWLRRRAARLRHLWCPAAPLRAQSVRHSASSPRALAAARSAASVRGRSAVARWSAASSTSASA